MSELERRNWHEWNEMTALTWANWREWIEGMNCQEWSKTGSFSRFLGEIELSLQSCAPFADLNFQECSEPNNFLRCDQSSHLTRNNTSFQAPNGRHPSEGASASLAPSGFAGLLGTRFAIYSKNTREHSQFSWILSEHLCAQAIQRLSARTIGIAIPLELASSRSQDWDGIAGIAVGFWGMSTNLVD